MLGIFGVGFSTEAVADEEMWAGTGNSESFDAEGAKEKDKFR
jgi:hypothetical protein